MLSVLHRECELPSFKNFWVSREALARLAAGGFELCKVSCEIVQTLRLQYVDCMTQRHRLGLQNDCSIQGSGPSSSQTLSQFLPELQEHPLVRPDTGR